MKVSHIFTKKQIIIEQESNQYEVRKIMLTDNNELQKFADFYNMAGQLSWQLNPSRIKSKIGTKGRLWGLYIKDSDMLVGTIAVKEIETELGEVGYLMLDPDHRSFKNVMTLYRVILKYSRKFESVYITTNIKNKTINKLLDKTEKIEKMFMAKSQFGGGANLLYVWIVKTGRENPERIREYFNTNIIQEIE